MRTMAGLSLNCTPGVEIELSVGSGDEVVAAVLASEMHFHNWYLRTECPPLSGRRGKTEPCVFGCGSLEEDLCLAELAVRLEEGTDLGSDTRETFLLLEFS